MLETKVQREAHKEIEEENFRKEVEEEKKRIRERRAAWRWWHSLIPFTVTITRRPKQ